MLTSIWASLCVAFIAYTHAVSVGSCAGFCALDLEEGANATNATCLDRYKWALGSQRDASGKKYSPTKALHYINRLCSEQCQCTMDEVPATCDDACITMDGSNTTCSARIKWLIQSTTSAFNTVWAATKYVNEECIGQCSCGGYEMESGCFDTCFLDVETEPTNCIDRYRYLIGTANDDKKYTPEEAMSTVNDRCIGQCECTVDEVDMSCDALCYTESRDPQSCRDRYKWLVGVNKSLSHDEALAYVNQQCLHQCACEGPASTLVEDCTGTCFTEDETKSTCERRAEYILLKADDITTPEQTLAMLNDQCAGQCACTEEDINLFLEKTCFNECFHDELDDLGENFIPCFCAVLV